MAVSGSATNPPALVSGEANRPDLNGASLERASRLFRAVGDVGRLQVLIRLNRGEACVTTLANDLGENLSTISERLRILRRAGLVVRRREGKRVHYRLADQHVIDIVANGIAHAAEEDMAT